MNENELQVGQKYFSEIHGVVEYCGTQEYRGVVYHNFYEPKFRLWHWLHPQDVSLPNKACTRQETGDAKSESLSTLAVSCG